MPFFLPYSAYSLQCKESHNDPLRKEFSSYPKFESVIFPTMVIFPHAFHFLSLPRISSQNLSKHNLKFTSTTLLKLFLIVGGNQRQFYKEVIIMLGDLKRRMKGRERGGQQWYPKI